MIVLAALLLLSCNKEKEDVSVVSNNVTKNQSATSEGIHYCTYNSMINYPLKSFYAVYKRVPSQQEYKVEIEALPWVLPGGVDSIKWVPDPVFPSKGELTYLSKGFSGLKTAIIDLNPTSAVTTPGCDGSTATFEETYNVSQADHIEYLRFRFIKDLFICGVTDYMWGHNNNLPSNLNEVESALGLKMKPNTTYTSYGLSFDFTGNPSITYENDKLPKLLIGTSSLVRVGHLSSSKGKIPANPFP